MNTNICIGTITTKLSAQVDEMDLLAEYEPAADSDVVF